MIIQADVYGSISEAVSDAINESIHRDTIVAIETKYYKDFLHTSLFEVCDDYVEIYGQDARLEGNLEEIREYWGINPDGDDWRVHLHILGH